MRQFENAAKHMKNRNFQNIIHKQFTHSKKYCSICKKLICVDPRAGLCSECNDIFVVAEGCFFCKNCAIDDDSWLSPSCQYNRG